MGDKISSIHSNSTSLWGLNQDKDRKDVQIPAFVQELHSGSAFDVAKKHPQVENSLTGGASIW